MKLLTPPPTNKEKVVFLLLTFGVGFLMGVAGVLIVKAL